MRTGALAAAVLLAAARARAADLAVVAPESPSAPYAEALRGLCDALGSCPPTYAPSEASRIPAGTKVVVALGGRAARARVPRDAALVTALTPDYEARAGAGDGPVVRVRLSYAPDDFARRLRRLKPAAARAVLLWSSPASARYAAAARAAGERVGLDIATVRASIPEEVPALLRSLPPFDALMLAPDSELVEPSVFAACREVARARGAAFFAPAPGLAERGAEPGLAPSFRAAGERAAGAARDLLAGRTPETDAYPEDTPLVGGAGPLVSTTTPAPVP